MSEFAGQWIGGFDGAETGLAVLDLEEHDGWLEGSLHAFDADPDNFNAFCPVNAIPEGSQLDFAVPAHAVEIDAPYLVDRSRLEGVDFPGLLQCNLTLNEGQLTGSWSSDNNKSGSVNLFKGNASEPSGYTGEAGVTNWVAFQQVVANLAKEPYRYIFRGQSEPWRLQTSFHRTKRKDLVRYWDNDIPRIRHASVGKTRYVFDSNSGEHNAAFLHLLQHHGYPTPMLDWTYSPYIAAYFAFASANPTLHPSKPVRVFMFDKKQWMEDHIQILHMTHCPPHFSLMEPLALGNDRALPQQSIAAITNLDDIELYIQHRERENDKKYLKVFDLSVEERAAVLQQLGLMGISPGSLFPGIEGVCREYRDRHFGYGN